MTLEHLTPEQREVMDLIADCPNGWDGGLRSTMLNLDQRWAWKELWEDGLADFVDDGAGTDWLVLTDRGRALREAG